MILVRFAGAVLAALALTISVANGQTWRVHRSVDTMSDRPKAMALVTSDDDHMVGIGRRGDRRVWFSLALPVKSFEQIDSRRAPIIRIDRHPANDMETARAVTARGLMNVYEWSPRIVHSVVWHGDRSEVESEALRQLRTGSTLRVRYYTAGGNIVEFTVPLEGADAAITQAIGPPSAGKR